MEILGGGPESDEALRRLRNGDGATTRRRPVTASLDLGTTNLAPEFPAPSGPSFVSDPLVPAAAIDQPAATARDGAGGGAADGAGSPPPEAHARDFQADFRADFRTTIFGSASLSIAGILVGFAGLTGGAPLLMLYATINSDPGAAPRVIAKGLSVIGVLAAALSFSALRRARATTPRWVGPVCGAAILIAAILLIAAGYFWWLSTAATTETVTY